MNVRNLAFAAAAVAVLGVAGTAHAAPTVAESVNGGANPWASPTWSAGDVGWRYTSSSSYGLVGIETKFAVADGRVVTLEIYDERPTEGGVLLRSAAFAPVTNAFAGAFFAELALVAGEDYFIGFRNVEDLGVNVTDEAGATNLGDIRYSNDGSYQFIDGGLVAQPILLFYEDVTVSVPEPTTLVLAGMGLAGFAFVRRRRAA